LDKVGSEEEEGEAERVEEQEETVTEPALAAQAHSALPQDAEAEVEEGAVEA
jgi:hypothetical protein